MAAPGTTKAVKYTLIAINMVIFLSGLVMLIGGSIVQSQINQQNLAHTIDGYSTQAGSVICIIFGIVVLLMSLFGLFSTIKDHYRFLFFFSAFMSFVFVIQFITGAVGLGVKNSGKFNDYISDLLKNDFNINSTLTQRKEGDEFQAQFKCCAWTSFRDDYIDANGTLNVPKSCCINQASCTTADSTGHQYYDKSCNLPIIDAFRSIIGTACTILLLFSFVNLAGIVLSIILGRSIKTGYQYT